MKASTNASRHAVLHLSETFSLPIEAVTEAIAILGRRGSGKTNTSVVLTEEMLAAGQQVVVVDPLGVWWGLRANADGTPSDLPVVIIGGEHADLPLTDTSGHALARLLVETGQSAVLDLSELSKAAMRRLMADLLEDLYRRNRRALHVVVDEADLLAPQRLSGEGARLLGAMEDVVRRGRVRGLGVTLITQRPAVLSKDVLSQAELLIALRMTSPRDVAAIDDWVSLHADEEQARTVRAALPTLPTGSAWVWSPGWIDVLERVEVRARRTFDSSATPVPGAPARTASLAQAPDIDALRERLSALVDPPKPARGAPARPPATKTPPAAPAAPAPVAALTDTDRQVLTELAEAIGELRPLIESVDRLQSLADAARAVLAKADTARAAQPRPSSGVPTRAARPDAAPDRSAPAEASALRAGALRMLNALADHHPLALTRAQLGTLAHVKSSGGTYSTYLSNLRGAGYVEEADGRLSLTDAGKAAAGVEQRTPMSAAELRETWRAVLRAGARRMFDVLVDAHPGWVDRSDLAASAGVAPTGGTFSTYLSNLRSGGLIEESGRRVRAAAVLFSEPTAQAAR